MVSKSEARYLSLAVVAGMLGVCVKTIRREIERGRFPVPVRVAGVHRIVAREFEAWATAREAERGM